MKALLNKLFVTAVVFTISFATASAQVVKWDSTYRPGKYIEQVAKFKADPKSKKDIVFLGNSITAGTDWAKLLDLPQAKNRGISGDITFGVLERLQDVIDGKPAKVFILIGINDISRNIPDSVILRNYKTMIARIRKGSKKTKIYFNTLLPVNAAFEKFKNHYGKDEHILWLNDEIRKFDAKNVTVIDLYPNFTDQDKHLKAELTKDGLHLIPAGYQVWADLLKKSGYLTQK
ncbi:MULTISPECIES: GDSL-type esterase/lipase family protein [unclassified Pedobacter]|uniref:GDSL-type esterase/lipase family protein n=1 Tax=unclassified Pedobacter TaxID=2628915 RepID=UPI00141FBCBF|nr:MULTISPECIES: GDSL-type esterase/lipase family protein [unclassified Pedobacter]NII82826.1 lysophospholipase L1-like esterase [Pedobacter sp. SG908]NMN36844.1 lysophospholipase L1-like esterase [Pedobacter sp. SG918]